MTVADLLRWAWQHGVQLSVVDVDGGPALDWRAPRGVASVEIKRALRAAKPALLPLLAQFPDVRLAYVMRLWSDAYAALNAGPRIDAAEQELRERFPRVYQLIDQAEADSRDAAHRLLGGDDAADQPLRRALATWRTQYETIALCLNSRERKGTCYPDGARSAATDEAR